MPYRKAYGICRDFTNLARLCVFKTHGPHLTFIADIYISQARIKKHLAAQRADFFTYIFYDIYQNIGPDMRFAFNKDILRSAVPDKGFQNKAAAPTLRADPRI